MGFTSNLGHLLQPLAPTNRLASTTPGGNCWRQAFCSSLCCASSVGSPSGPDEGRGKLGSPGGCTAQAAALTAQGVLRPLNDTTKCPTCNLPMQREAAYRCQKCQSVFHVRCMGHHAAVGQRQLKYGTTCFLCTLSSNVHQRPPQHAMSSDALELSKGDSSTDKGAPPAGGWEDGLIIDVMGVCQ